MKKGILDAAKEDYNRALTIECTRALSPEEVLSTPINLISQEQEIVRVGVTVRRHCGTRLSSEEGDGAVCPPSRSRSRRRSRINRV